MRGDGTVIQRNLKARIWPEVRGRSGRPVRTLRQRRVFVSMDTLEDRGPHRDAANSRCQNDNRKGYAAAQHRLQMRWIKNLLFRALST